MIKPLILSYSELIPLLQSHEAMKDLTNTHDFSHNAAFIGQRSRGQETTATKIEEETKVVTNFPVEEIIASPLGATDSLKLIIVATITLVLHNKLKVGPIIIVNNIIDSLQILNKMKCVKNVKIRIMMQCIVGTASFIYIPT